MDRRRDIPVLFFPHPAIWAVLSMFFAGAVAWAWMTHFTFYPLSGGHAVVAAYIGAILTLMFAAAVILRERWPNLSRALFSWLLVMLLIKTGVMLNYLGARAAFPLIDAWLHRADVALGFNWMAHVARVNSHPQIISLLAFVYKQISPVLLLTFFILAAMRDARRLHEYISLLFMTLMVVNICSIFLPATGAYAFLHPSADMTGNMPPDIAGRHSLIDFMALRTGEMTSAAFDKVTGIVTFPSFHAIAALLTTWVLRDRKIFFWPFAIFNLISLVSAISIGGHYLTDLIGGAVTLGLSIIAYRAWETWPARAAKAYRTPLAAGGGAGA